MGRKETGRPRWLTVSLCLQVVALLVLLSALTCVLADDFWTPSYWAGFVLTVIGGGIVRWSMTSAD